MLPSAFRLVTSLSFVNIWAVWEVSPDPGGLLGPIKTAIPVAFALTIQGLVFALASRSSWAART